MTPLMVRIVARKCMEHVEQRHKVAINVHELGFGTISSLQKGVQGIIGCGQHMACKCTLF